MKLVLFIIFVAVILILALFGALCLYSTIRAHYSAAEETEPLGAVTVTALPPIEHAIVYDAAPADHPPAVIAVGPFHWTVKYVKFGPGKFADTYYKPLEIQLDPTLPRDQLRETLLHEIFHTCIFVGGGGTSGSRDSISEDAFIEQSAPTLLQVLRDNPELVAWLARK